MALVAPILSPEKSSQPALLASPARTPSRTSRRTSRTPTAHRISIAQPQASPSPRKAILHNPKAVSFTPKATRKAPRAWERRPATPFVPRNEGQKIWKRVPLADLGTEANRKVEKSSEDYVRVVKKLKMEGEAVEAKKCVDDEEGLVVRKIPVVVFDTQEQPVNDLPDEGDVEAVVPGWEPDEVAREATSAKSESEHLENSVNDGEQTDESTFTHVESCADDAAECGEDVVQHETTSISDLDTAADPTGDMDRPDELSPEKVDSPSQFNTVSNVEVVGLEVSEVISSVEDPATTNEDNQAKSVECAESETAQIFADDNATQHTLDTTGLADAESFSPVKSLSPDEVDTQQPTSDEDDNQLNCVPATETLDAQDLRKTSGSEVTVVTTDHSSEDAAVTAEVKSGMEAETEVAQTENSVECVQDGLSRPRPSLDDTAFLHAFLSRTKAQRAARNLEKQDNDSQETAMESVGFEPIEPIKQDTMNTDHPEPAAESGQEADTQAPKDADLSEAPSSPVRRSKRAATVQSSAASIPRIQLKRAVGSEFIFTANKAQTPANVAMTTRTNTKRNRGQSVAVQARLDQLRSGSDFEGRSAESDEAENMGRKRRRDRTEKTELCARKKVLRWNDERLTTYREADANAEEYLEGNGVSERDQTQETENNTMQEEDEQDEELSALAKKISSPSKVRRVRRNVAITSAAETPSSTTPFKPIATKARSRRGTATTAFSNEPEVATEMDKVVSETEKTSKSSALPAPRRSRMPVRVGRQGATIAAKQSEQAKDASAATRSTDDVLGKRRLRVRS